MSEKYIVSARKYRPQTFASVVGQRNLAETLKGSINSGRLAHAYLFCGPRGVGKTSCARIFARTINCLHPTADGEACGECESCKAITNGNSFNLLELDAASNNSVNDIRTITEQVAIPPQVGKYRVFIIDEVHMLTSAAFNAFLKTLEEPPEYAIFILATTEKHKVIPTILSRCQIYDFKRITIEDIVEHLSYVAQNEGITADRRALGVIARKADGGMRDALSIFDQVATSSHGNITYETTVENLNVLAYEYFFQLIDAFAKGDAAQSLLLYKEIRDRGFDSLFFVNSLAQHVRDLMVAVDSRTLPLLEVPDDTRQQLRKQASSLPLKWYFAAMKLLNDCDLNYRTATNKQLLVEITLIRLSQLMVPQQPPFDISDRKVALRNPSEQTGATPAPSEATTAPSAMPTPTPAPAPTETPSGAPSVASTPRPSARPRPAAGANFRPHSFNLSAGKKAADATLQKLDEDFSDEDFLKAWNAYITSNPDKMILVGAMRKTQPRRIDRISFGTMVEHPAQLQAFEHHLTHLLEFLRSRLRNDFITVRATIDTTKAVAKHLPPAEFLKKALDNNPSLKELLREIDAEVDQ